MAVVAELREYLTAANRSPYAAWFRRLDVAAAARVVIALSRLETGNTSNVKALGEGVNELKIHFGPGYRIYFGWDGPEVVILLAGGTKRRQDADIGRARLYWSDYKVRKAEARKKAAKQCH
jgi:putative addiction module killer protein